ncbi:MAG: hypothetical protein JWP08_1916 [Bryobacterales bacterium]|nr:hypothetical protein [Bryobacterales bacterium]
MSRPQYDDGLDDDGFPIEREPMPRYRHGSEAEAGGFPGDKPIERVGTVFLSRAFDGIAMAGLVSRHTESPIETMLAVAILRQWPDMEFRTHDAGPGKGWSLIPQYPWGSFRVDLALRKPDGFLIFIECDGHEFHSSPEQVERDRIREQMMVDRGYPVVRFTGSEINYSPVACAQKLLRFRRWGT